MEAALQLEFGRLLAGSFLSPFLRLSYKLGKSFISALLLFAVLFLLVAVCEAVAGASLRRYVSRNFFNDLIYALFYQGGVYTLFVYQPFFNVLRPQLEIVDLHLLNRLPVYWSLPIYFLIIDFLGYWIHRLQHTRLFWPFHSVHHSQQTLTFATFYRFHLVEEFIANTAAILPLLLLGAPPVLWLPIRIIQWFLQAIQHSELNWRMGPLYRVIAGPVFHSMHHSPETKYFNKNFGMAFSIWDFLFGTAINTPTRCHVYGVAGLTMPETISGQFAEPFRMLYRQIFPQRQAEPKTRQELDESDVRGEPLT
jgi:sterol desaturase/sphingolipid hydroxylase (fatty acid hydroxylase superfamily)